MRCRLPAVALVLCGLLPSIVRGDGLIYQLPEDGTWAKYTVKLNCEQKFESIPAQKYQIEGTLTISSVGEVLRNEQPCRWIELKFESQSEETYPRLVLKMLIPVDKLKRGEDPLAHAILTFFHRKPMDKKRVESFIEKGFNRVQYEIDRFRDVFPRPLSQARSLPREMVKTAAGTFEDCEVVAGTSSYDGPLVEDGRTVFDARYKTTIHPQSPFGVVGMTIELDGREYGDEDVGVLRVKATKTLTLAQTGTRAVSALPAIAEKRK